MVTSIPVTVMSLKQVGFPVTVRVQRQNFVMTIAASTHRLTRGVRF
jgi:hypothetical protein